MIAASEFIETTPELSDLRHNSLPNTFYDNSMPYMNTSYDNPRNREFSVFNHSQYPNYHNSDYESTSCIPSLSSDGYSSFDAYYYANPYNSNSSYSMYPNQEKMISPSFVPSRHNPYSSYDDYYPMHSSLCSSPPSHHGFRHSSLDFEPTSFPYYCPSSDSSSSLPFLSTSRTSCSSTLSSCDINSSFPLSSDIPSFDSSYPQSKSSLYDPFSYLSQSVIIQNSSSPFTSSDSSINQYDNEDISDISDNIISHSSIDDDIIKTTYVSSSSSSENHLNSLGNNSIPSSCPQQTNSSHSLCSPSFSKNTSLFTHSNYIPTMTSSIIPSSTMNHHSKSRKGPKKPIVFDSNEIPGNPDDIDASINPRVFSGKKPKKNMDYSRFVINIERIKNGEDTRLTVMLKNIPNGFNQAIMLAILDSFVKNEYDFFYMPVDFKTNCNLGFGYVSMINTASVCKLYNSLNHKRWPNTPSTKVCEVVYARMQGKNDMQKLCKEWAIMQLPDKYRPVFFEKTVVYENGKENIVMKRCNPIK